MQKTITSYESTPTEINCVALYKVARCYGIKLPEPKILVYLAGILHRINDPREQPSLSKFVVGSIDELAYVEEKHKSDRFPNIIPYKCARNSGDFFLNWNAMVSADRDYSFPSTCYSVAQFHSKKIGYKEQSGIFGDIASRTDRYIDLLAIFNRHLKDNPDFEVNDTDFEDLKNDLNISFKKYKNEVTAPTGFKKNISHKLLI